MMIGMAIFIALLATCLLYWLSGWLDDEEFNREYDHYGD